MDPRHRRVLLDEIERLSRQDRNTNEQLLERFLQCPEAQDASTIIASVTGGNRSFNRTRTRPIPTPSGLLPWLQ